MSERKGGQRRRVHECIECHLVKSMATHNLCQKCYRRTKPKRECVKCHVVATIAARGLCNKCRGDRHRVDECIDCHVVGKIKGYDRCGKCYRAMQWECASCHLLKTITARNLCPKCYERIRPERECVKCHVVAKITAHDLCDLCYIRQPYRKEKLKAGKVKYKNSPEGRAAIKRYNHLESTKIRKERWYLLQPEDFWIKRRRNTMNSNFFRSHTQPVGPFDPKQIMNDRLLKAFQEVMTGDLPIKQKKV